MVGAPAPSSNDAGSSYLSDCFSRILKGNLSRVPLESLVPRSDPGGKVEFQAALAAALGPRLRELRVCDGGEAATEKWAYIEEAACVLAEVTAAEPWGGEELAGAVRAAAARALA
ncbi:unnamed protein product, partial [Polarella glacialis]